MRYNQKGTRDGYEGRDQHRGRLPGGTDSLASRFDPSFYQKRAFSVFAGEVIQSGAKAESEKLARWFSVDPELDRALTHGFHPYAGRMPPSIARAAIAEYAPPGATVVDPFCGSGTVLVEAFVAGHAAFGVDASPLATAIASVRTNPLTDELRTALVVRSREIAEEVEDRARERIRPKVPLWARGEFEKFFPHVCYELLTLREAVWAQEGSPELQQALRMSFSSLLVKFMRRGPEAPRDGEEKRIGRGQIARFYASRVSELAHGLAAIDPNHPASSRAKTESVSADASNTSARKQAPLPQIENGDARELRLENASAGFVLSSPPYAGIYDYRSQHETRFTWLELPQRRFIQRQLGSRPEVGSFGVSRGEWDQQRNDFMREIARVLAPGASCLLVVGDGVVSEKPEDAAADTAEAGERFGLQFVACASQERPSVGRHLSSVYQGLKRYEHLLLLRKPA